MVPGAPSFSQLGSTGAGGSSVPLYLPLLNMGQGAKESITAVETAVQHSSDVDAELAALLAEVNWRPHLPAAVAIASGYGGPVALDALWIAFERSWVSPQLAAAASLHDPGFEERARGYRIPSTTLRDPDAPYVDGKQTAALVYLCGAMPTARAWLGQAVDQPAVQRALEQDATYDRGGEIAKHWLDGLRRHVKRLRM
jgi:hypothetical protein